jgi:hypothetical protein
MIKHKTPFDVGLFEKDFNDILLSLSSPKQLDVKRVSHSYANIFVKHHHYLKRKVYIARNVSYGLYAEHYCVGVAMFGFPVWTEYPEICPPLNVNECPELIRLCTVSGLPKNSESRFLSSTMKRMKKDWLEESGVAPKCITSFCDLAFGFNGSIYKATNFRLLRITEGRSTNAGGKHGKWGGNKDTEKGRKAMYVFYY